MAGAPRRRTVGEVEAGELVRSVWDALFAAATTRDAPLDLLSVWPVLVCLGAIAAVVWTPVWRWLRLGDTLVHEGGHVVLAVLMGRSLEHVQIHHDSSGVTSHRGQRGVRAWLVAAGGYPAPGMLAIGLGVAVETGWAGPVLAGLGVLALLGILWCRGWVTLGVLLVAAALSLGLALSGETGRQLGLLGLAVMLSLGGLHSGVEQAQANRHSPVPGSDAAALGWGRRVTTRLMARLLLLACLAETVALGVLLFS